MKLLLKEDVENLGACGDEVTVKDGYGRNYLIPRGKAILATPDNLKAFNHQKSVVQAKLRKLQSASQQIADRIAAEKCVFIRKVGDQDKLFGAVTSHDIAEFLRGRGIEVDRRKIILSEPIKKLGDFKAGLKLPANVTAQINVTVVKEEEAAPAAEPPAAAPAS